MPVLPGAFLSVSAHCCAQRVDQDLCISARNSYCSLQPKPPPLRLVHLLPLILCALPAVNAAVACNAHDRCEELLWKGSRCKNGYCTNPFEGGCLGTILKEDHYAEKYGINSGASAMRRRALSVQRMCNSEDSNFSICRRAGKDSFPEVRIFPNNWESSISTSWILQIILSELLDVPSTLETGVADTNMNFYNEENRMEYGISDGTDGYASFQNAFDAEGGDCTTYAASDGQEGRDYIPCAHHLPEMWASGKTLYDMQAMGVMDEARFTGAIGRESWYIPKFTLERDSSLAIYFGYQQNRRKLAEIFKRPTTWGEYCTQVSINNCSFPDGIAERAPADDGSEDGRYFVEGGIYIGHFRATDKNNCTENPNCTGHFMDFPCTWSIYFKQQAHHLGIALESNGNEVNGGYTYAEMVDIWNAANATKSDVIGQWWRPDATFTSFVGTEFELTEVALPAATKKCIEARAADLYDTTCDSANASVFEQYGSAVGACQEPPKALRKATVGNMESNIKQNKNPRVAMSPAYDFLQNFQLTDLQLDEILLEWLMRGIDKYNFDLRLASCKWVADNLENIQTQFLPPSHPRAFVESSSQNTPLSISAMIVNSLTIVLVVAIACLVSGTSRPAQRMEMPQRRSRFKDLSRLQIRQVSQIEFVYLILAGLFLVPIGALLMAFKPSKGTCNSSQWLVDVGYTLVFVPILVKVSAIIRLVEAGKKCRRATVDKEKLLKVSFGISGIAAVFCALWTGLDPMEAKEELTLTNKKSHFDETLVRVSYYCESDSAAWAWISFAWKCLLLLSASVLAFQMRYAPKSVNDSKQLAFMVYTSAMFVILRTVLHVTSTTLAEGPVATKSSFQKATSLLWGIDSLVSVAVYFYKIFGKTEATEAPIGRFGATMVTTLRKQETGEEEKVEDE